MWARVTGAANRNANTIEGDLKRVSESGVIDIPKELLTVIVDASFDPDNRRTIMQHLRECLAEQSSKRWRRIYAGLVIIEDLLQRGSPALVFETAEGHHFDLVQRLSFLENFERTFDRRIQTMVRQKASSLRTDLVARLQTASAEEANSVPKDTASTCSPGAASVRTCSTAATGPAESMSSYSSEMPPVPISNPEPKGVMILNGIVAVGHRDDTTSESSGDDTRKPVRFRDDKKVPNRRTRRERQQSSDSEASNSGRRSAPSAGVAKAPAPAAQPEIVDLLEL